MLRKLVAITAAFFSISAFGATAAWNATVLGTLIDDENFGGCMARIAPQPASRSLNCPGGWVTFSCSGDFTTVETGNRKFQAAQLAMMTGTMVFIQVDDLRKHNGFCYARRVDNLPN
jgi:hypothetical protein